MLTETFGTTTQPDRSRLLLTLHRHDPDHYLEAMITGCAMTAGSDGRVTPAERATVLSLICNDPLLSLYPAQAVTATFDTRVRAFAEDPAAAFADAIHTLAEVSDRPAQARAILRACLIVTGADGRTTSDEVSAVRAIREALNLGPTPAVRTAEWDDLVPEAVVPVARTAATTAAGTAIAASEPIADRFVAAAQAARRLQSLVAQAAQVRKVRGPLTANRRIARKDGSASQ